MKIYFLLNCDGNVHSELYDNPAAFYDLNQKGEQEKMALDIEQGDQCIVASYTEDKTNLQFKWYLFDREDIRPHHSEEGLQVRVFYGRLLTDESMLVQKSTAAVIFPFCKFFKVMETSNNVQRSVNHSTRLDITITNQSPWADRDVPSGLKQNLNTLALDRARTELE